MEAVSKKRKHSTPKAIVVAKRSVAQKKADTTYQKKQKVAGNAIRRIRWCWRVNANAGHDATDEEREEEAQALKKKLDKHCEVYVFQLERGEAVSEANPHGYYHFQGYLELKNKNRKDYILKNIEAFNYCEASKGSAKQGWDYGSKEATRIRGPWSLGEPSVEGKRTDILDFKEAIKKGCTDRELWDSFPGCMAKYPDMVLRIRETFHVPHVSSRPVRTEELQVVVIYGKPGTGKSYAVRQRFPNIYVLPFGNKVWLTPEGCDAAEILIEDFSGEMHLKQLNRLLDPYPDQVERKNGHLWYMPNIVVITTNVKPSLWFDYQTRQDVKEQLLRRITVVFDFNTVEGRKFVGITPQQLEAHNGDYPEIPKPVRPPPKFNVNNNCFTGPQREVGEALKLVEVTKKKVKVKVPIDVDHDDDEPFSEDSEPVKKQQMSCTECNEEEPYYGTECGSCDGVCWCICHIGTRQDPKNFDRVLVQEVSDDEDNTQFEYPNII